MIRFTANGIPKGQPRPRAFARGGKARVYDPGTAEGWKSAVAEAARPFLPEKPFAGPVRVMLDFAMPRPKSHFNKKGLKVGAPTWFTGKPDCDNLAKSTLDCLTTIGMWTDDALVVELTVSKEYVGIGVPGATVSIQEEE